MTETKETINGRIIDIIKHYVKLDAKNKGHCPFHNEKTPSFHVHRDKQIYKCFGCGAAGDAIDFLMQKENLDFVGALELGAKILGIPFERKFSKEDKQIIDDRTVIKSVNTTMAKYFHGKLSGNSLTYIMNRGYKRETIDKFQLGWAPKAYNIENDTALRTETLETAGLIRYNEDKTKYYFYRDRVIFPIHDYMGRVTGFSGRDISPKPKIKYLNNAENAFFKRGELLYGLFQNKAGIVKAGYAVLVEGYTDVITMHQAGAEVGVGGMGTAMTEKQAERLKYYTDKVYMAYDNDTEKETNSGQEAAVKNGIALLRAGFDVYVITLPEGKDPDDHYKEPGTLETDIESAQLFTDWYADRLFSEAGKDKIARLMVIRKVISLLAEINDTLKRNVFLDDLKERYKPIKDWTAALQEHDKLAKKSKKDSTIELDDEGLQSDEKEMIMKYDFFARDNKYYFRERGGGRYKVSNFVMRPMFHVLSSNEPSRLFELENEHGAKQVIEFDMEAITGLQKFRRVIEGYGNYIWFGNENNFLRLRAFLYHETKTCKEISSLGWQPQGFYAWANGIYNGTYRPVDNNGIVEYKKGEHYFIPALSDIYSNDMSVFYKERLFVKIDKDVTFGEWAKLFVRLFGDNAKMAIAFLFAAVFYDYLLNRYKHFPMLNVFGPMGSGKTSIGRNLLSFFMINPQPIFLRSATAAGLAESFEMFRNAIIFLDEYKNDLELWKIQVLKDIYDARGRTKSSIIKNKKVISTGVCSAIILGGQDMPTLDNALTDRLIMLPFKSFSDAQKKKQKSDYDKLTNMIEGGMSHLIPEIIDQRKYFINNYTKFNDQVIKDMDNTSRDISARQFQIYSIILTTFKTLDGKFELPFDYDDLLKIGIKRMDEQANYLRSNNETQRFWDSFESLFLSGRIRRADDFIIHTEAELQCDETSYSWPVHKEVLYLRLNRVYSEYAEATRRAGESKLDKPTLEYYLKNDTAYLGKKRSKRFENGGPTSAYCFDYSHLNISVRANIEDDINNIGVPRDQEPVPAEKDLPF